MTDRTAPADPREAWHPLTATEEAWYREYATTGSDTTMRVGFRRLIATLDHERRMADTEVVDRALAARQDEPSPALRLALERLVRAVEQLTGSVTNRDELDGAYRNATNVLDEAANPPQTREAEGARDTARAEVITAARQTLALIPVVRQAGINRLKAALDALDDLE